MMLVAAEQQVPPLRLPFPSGMGRFGRDDNHGLAQGFLYVSLHDIIDMDYRGTIQSEG
jgi:hypothetical protein